MILPSFHPPLHPPSYPTSIHLSFPPHHPFSTLFHSTSSPTTANIQNHPCYCVTVLLCYCVRSFSPPPRPAFLSPTLPSLPHTLLPHILSYPLSRTFVSAQMYIRSRANVPSPSQTYFMPLEPETQKTRLLASGITLIFIVPNSIQLGMRQEVTRYRCWRGAAVGSSESDNTPPTRTFQRKIRRLEK